jgi:uncharacterized membrane protein
VESLAVIAAILFFICPIAALLVAINTKSKATALEQKITALQNDLARLRTDVASARQHAPDTPVAAPAPAQAAMPIPAPQSEPTAAPPITQTATKSPPAKPAAAPWSNTRPPQPAISRPDPAWLLTVKQWLFGGNLVAKMGLLILFIGVSFLLKYAAARVTLPIELRLAGITLADIALLIWGWRIREKRPGISLPVQGASIAILMLVTFGAFRLYHLIPAGLAFGLLFVLTAFTCLLAVLQNAIWLAIFGIAGGFAAPLLTATGQGNHIGLFSYYAILNAGIFGIAWVRSWRTLNLLGFVFTFLIGSAWGVLKYTPDHYLSAQLFLTLFFAFYVAIAVLYARRQAPQLKNYVDATLVFGTPLVSFGLQFGLVRHLPFGAAFSSLALGLFYTGLAFFLWRRKGSSLKMLAEAFFALGIVFGTLAIPFALDGRWTSAAWALEGAGIVWIGLRQRQTLAWVFGLLVQAGAWMSFLGSVTGLDPAAARQSNLWLGFLLLAATAFLMAVNFRTRALQAAQSDSTSVTTPAQNQAFGPFATLFLALASIWFVAGAWTEIWLRTSGATQATLLTGSALIAATGLGFIAQRMQWRVAQYFAVALQLIAGNTLLLLALIGLNWPSAPASANLLDGPFMGALLIGAGAGFTSWVFHRQQQAEGSAKFRRWSRALLLWSGFWWFGLVLQALTGWITVQYGIFMHLPPERADNLLWWFYGIGLAGSSPLFATLARRLAWPDLRWSALPAWLALALTSVGLLIALYAGGMPGREVWCATLALWLAAEWLMRFWQANAWQLTPTGLKCLHIVRTIGPWLMLWPAGGYWIASWLDEGDNAQQQLLAEAGWFTSGSWARYLPAWGMMLALAWLMRRVRSGGWPVAPLARWYQVRVAPLAALWSITLVALWNLTQNGAMAPLPYLPLLNPLDLSTCFAILLGVASYRLLGARLTDAAPGLPAPTPPIPTAWLARLPFATGVAVYLWLNLMLLRTAAHVLDIPYQFDRLFASTTVQTLLSLVWTVTALLLMRHAAKKGWRTHWVTGAALLGVVVGKLFLVDQSSSGGVERIIAFVGVGLLMVLIGYLAPYPTQSPQDKPPPQMDR